MFKRKNRHKMPTYPRTVFWALLICQTQLTFGCVNDTISIARMISDINESYRDFQRSGRNIGGRDGRKLVSFVTRNDNIQIGLEFDVPFISIPVKRSIDQMKQFASSPSTYVTNPMVNINTAAVGLTGAVLVAGVATAFIWKGFIRDQLLYRKKQNDRRRTSDHFNEFEDESQFNRFTNTIEKMLQKYNIDATACTQRTLCMAIRDASQNVARGIGSSSEKIFDGIVSASWIKRLTSGTAIHDAITTAHQSFDCERKYSNCRLKINGFEDILERMLMQLNR